MSAGVSIAFLESCTACGACIVTCPEGALRRAPRRPWAIAHRCTACFACVEVCPVDAVVIGATHR